MAFLILLNKRHIFILKKIFINLSVQYYLNNIALLVLEVNEQNQSMKE